MRLTNYSDFAEVQQLSTAFNRLKDFPGMETRKDISAQEALPLIRKNYKYFGYDKKPKLSTLNNAFKDGKIIGGGRFATANEIAASYKAFTSANQKKREILTNQLADNKQNQAENKKLYRKTRRKIWGARFAKTAMVLVGLGALAGLGFGGFMLNGVLSTLSVGWQIGSWAAAGVGTIGVLAAARVPLRALWNKLSSISFKNKLKVLGNGKGTKSELTRQKALQKTIKKELQNTFDIEKTSSFNSERVLELNNAAKNLPKTTRSAPVSDTENRMTPPTPPVPPTPSMDNDERHSEDDHDHEDLGDKGHGEDEHDDEFDLDDLDGVPKPSVEPNPDKVTEEEAIKDILTRQDWYKKVIDKLKNSEKSNFIFSTDFKFASQKSSFNYTGDIIEEFLKSIGKASEDIKAEYEQLTKEETDKKPEYTSEQINAKLQELENAVLACLQNELLFTLSEEDVAASEGLLTNHLEGQDKIFDDIKLIGDVSDLSKLDDKQLEELKTKYDDNLKDCKTLTEGHSELGAYDTKFIKKLNEDSLVVDNLFTQDKFNEVKTKMNEFLSNGLPDEVQEIIQMLTKNGETFGEKVTELSIRLKDEYTKATNKANDKFVELSKQDFVTCLNSLEKYLDANSGKMRSNTKINKLYQKLLESRLKDIELLQAGRKNDRERQPE